MTESPDELLGKLRGVTGPEMTPIAPAGSNWIWLVPVAAAILIVLVIWLRRRVPRVGIPSLEAMKQLSRQPPALGLAKWDEIVRQHLQQVFQLCASSLTTPELIATLDCESAKQWSQELSFVEEVRFSGGQLSQPEWSGLVNRTVALIQAECEDPAGASSERSGVK